MRARRDICVDPRLSRCSGSSFEISIRGRSRHFGAGAGAPILGTLCWALQHGLPASTAVSISLYAVALILVSRMARVGRRPDRRPPSRRGRLSRDTEYPHRLQKYRACRPVPSLSATGCRDERLAAFFAIAIRSPVYISQRARAEQQIPAIEFHERKPGESAAGNPGSIEPATSGGVPRVGRRCPRAAIGRAAGRSP